MASSDPPTVEPPRNREEEELFDLITDELTHLRWPVKRPFDRTRTNVVAYKHVEVRGFVLGKVRRYDKPGVLVESQYNAKFPHLLKLLRRLMRVHNPNFRYNAIQLNSNVQTSPHYDKHNRGRSYCTAVGRYTGGGLTIYRDDSDVPSRVFRNKRKWVKYDGGRTKHGSAPVTSGTRFAIIYFTATPLRRSSRATSSA